jgi:hypothetical protein
MSRSCMGRIIEEIIPFFHYVRFKHRFLRAGTGVDTPQAAASYEMLSEEELGTLLKEERQRAASMDEKTFKLTLALTFALTIMGTVSTVMLGSVESIPLRVAMDSLLALVVFYALAAGFVALGAMRTLPSYGLGAYPEFKNKPGARRQFLASSLARNEQIGLARHARNETAYTSLRNSFLCLFASLALFAILQALPVAKSARSWLTTFHSTSAVTPASRNSCRKEQPILVPHGAPMPCSKDLLPASR